MSLTIGSLFSGIGGLELGLERAGLGPVVWQVEIDPYCRAVLARHWPAAQRFEDVRTVKTLADVDLVCGGFPCTDISSAGKRAGIAGARSGLWIEFRRIVEELRPSWVLVENVISGSAKWVDIVSGDLGERGYAVVPVPLAACDAGLPHNRSRIFIVASNTQPRRVRQQRDRIPLAAPGRATSREPADASEARIAADVVRRVGPRLRRKISGSLVRGVHGLSAGLDTDKRRIAALGNSVVPQCAEVIGHVIRQLEADASEAAALCEASALRR